MTRSIALMNAQIKYRNKNKELLRLKTKHYADKYYYSKNWE